MWPQARTCAHHFIRIDTIRSTWSWVVYSCAPDTIKRRVLNCIHVVIVQPRCVRITSSVTYNINGVSSIYCGLWRTHTSCVCVCGYWEVYNNIITYTLQRWHNTIILQVQLLFLSLLLPYFMLLYYTVTRTEKGKPVWRLDKTCNCCMYPVANSVERSITYNNLFSACLSI